MGAATSETAPMRRPIIGRLVPVVLFAVAIVFLIGALAIVLSRRGGQASTNQIRASGIPASVSTRTANLMALSPIPHKPAPGFVLTDQLGRRLSLSSFRGKVVVLEFMDPHCVDICPLVSDEFRDAYKDLGTKAHDVVFIAVNVNQYHRRVADMLAFSREHQLVTIPSWHFFTGPVPSLKHVWASYNVAVSAPNPNADIVHASFVYFIDPQGHERFLASPMVDHTKTNKAYLPASQLTAWGRGIALVAENLAKH